MADYDMTFFTRPVHSKHQRIIVIPQGLGLIEIETVLELIGSAFVGLIFVA